MKALNLKGKKFGKLTAKEIVYKDNVRSWLCECECGEKVVVSTSQLTSGNKKTCTKCNEKDTIDKYLNKQYGDLTVISFNSRDNNNRMLFNCECKCGNKKVVSAKNLSRGVSKDCGCKQKERISKNKRKEYGESNKNILITSYKNNAKKKNLSFSLTKQQMEELFKGNCYYCGCKPSQVKKAKNTYGEFVYNGIDRLDSSKGYEKDNVVSCCSTCNYLKSDYSEKEFLQIIKRIATYKKL